MHVLSLTCDDRQIIDRWGCAASTIIAETRVHIVAVVVGMPLRVSPRSAVFHVRVALYKRDKVQCKCDYIIQLEGHCVLPPLSAEGTLMSTGSGSTRTGNVVTLTPESPPPGYTSIQLFIHHKTNTVTNWPKEHFVQ